MCKFEVSAFQLCPHYANLLIRRCWQCRLKALTVRDKSYLPGKCSRRTNIRGSYLKDGKCQRCEDGVVRSATTNGFEVVGTTRRTGAGTSRRERSSSQTAADDTLPLEAAARGRISESNYKKMELCRTEAARTGSIIDGTIPMRRQTSRQPGFLERAKISWTLRRARKRLVKVNNQRRSEAALTSEMVSPEACFD